MNHDLEALILAEANDDDIEYAILHNIIGEAQVEVMGELQYFNLEEINPARVKTDFRFEKQDLYRLARALRIPDVIQTETRNRVTGLTGLCILLRRLAYPGRLKDIQHMFNLSPQSLSQIIKYMISFFVDHHLHLLNNLRDLPWLNQGRMELYADAVCRNGGAVGNCWGFIDGTARAICRPTVQQEEYYSGHKRFHCIKFQSVLSPDGIIVSLKGPFTGRRHDAAIFRDSNLYRELQEVAVFPNNNYTLYGDQAYPLSDLLLCPFPFRQQGIPIYQQQFNNSMKVLRASVEWGFQKVCSQFAFLDFKKNQKIMLQDVGNMYKVGVLLVNCHTTLYGSQTSDYFNVIPPNLENYLAYNY